MLGISRQSDKFRWHCGPHPCQHEDVGACPEALRYSVVHQVWAFSLVVCPGHGQLSFHRTWSLVVPPAALAVADGVEVDDMFSHCDLLSVDCALASFDGRRFWAQHGAPDSFEQPSTFWYELEKEASRWASHLGARDIKRAVC